MASTPSDTVPNDTSDRADPGAERVADRFVALIQREQPDWGGVDDPQFVADEIDYKQAAAAKTRELLDENALRGLLDEGRFDEVVDRLLKVARSTNLLFLGAPSSGDLAVLYTEDLDRPAFCAAVLDLLYGPGDSPERLSRFVSFLEDRGLPNKWTFPTYLLFLRFPETEFFVKPSVTQWFLHEVGAPGIYSSKPDGDIYAEILAHVRALREDLRPFGAEDMIDVQSAIYVAYAAARDVEKHRPSGPKRREMESLFPEFVETYLTAPTGRTHHAQYEKSRIQARKSYQEFQAARASGEDVTNRVLLELLPYTDTESNRRNGAWISAAPSITGDLRRWFEASSWREAEDWDEVAQAILGFIERALDEPSGLAATCRAFSELPWSKGFQAGMLTPVLNALLPDEFLLVNNKSRRLINYLAGTSLSQKLVDFPELNRIGKVLLEDLSDLLDTAPGEGRSNDVFDAFSHWLTAVRDFPFGDPQYWKIAPGEGAKYWEDCLLGGYISIGWNELGDLSGISLEEFERRRDRLVSEHEGWTPTGVEQVWKVAKEVREGDKVVANEGISRVLGFGTVTGPYEHVPDAPYAHRRPVDWHDTQPRRVHEGGWRRTVVKLDRGRYNALKDQPIDVDGLPVTPAGQPPAEPEREEFPINDAFPIPDCAAELRMDPAEIERWVRAIERKGQAIFYGPPGTGKTYAAEKVAAHLIGGDDGFTELVQLHPSYSYEDFIQGIRPEPLPGGGLAYPLRRGRFLDFCSRAREREGRCVFIVDEINRANLSRVFGELMYLLEYRERAIPLAAGGEPFSIPENVRLLGTMNTADRLIAMVDHALRRRFAFLELRPSYETLRRFHEGNSYDAEPLIELLRDVNRAIDDRHYEVGITYFLINDLAEHLEDIWTLEVLPYLDEHFYDQPDRVDPFRWKMVRQKLTP